MGAQSSAPADAVAAPEAWGTDRGLQSTLDGSSVSDLDDALIEAVADGDAEATAALLTAGANVNHLSVENELASPVILASQEGSLDCLTLLLKVAHVELDRAARFGLTASHMAAHWDRSDCLHALLEAGADVSLQAKGAGTAAHIAAARDSEASLLVLLAHGVSPDALDAEGRSVYEAAVRCGSDRCVARLDEWDDLHRPAAEACRVRRPQCRGEREALHQACGTSDA